MRVLVIAVLLVPIFAFACESTKIEHARLGLDKHKKILSPNNPNIALVSSLTTNPNQQLILLAILSSHQLSPKAIQLDQSIYLPPFCLDELDLVELVIALERIFELTISADELNRIELAGDGSMTINALTKIIDRKLVARTLREEEIARDQKVYDKARKQNEERYKRQQAVIKSTPHFASPISVLYEQGTCNITGSKTISFTHPAAEDTLELSLTGESCSDVSYTFRVISEKGEQIYLGTASAMKFHGPATVEEYKGFVKSLLRKAMANTSLLPAEFRCEIEKPNCKPFERNTVPMDEYLKIKSAEIPMLNHATYYEGWVAIVYNKKLGKGIKVYEGGL